MKKFFTLSYLFVAGLITSCESSSSYEGDGVSDEYELLDGDFCAEVNYFNPNTGTSSTYTLNVQAEDGYLVKIYWPNGGWLDHDHFTPVSINGGYCSFTSDMGYEYKVHIQGSPCSYTNTSVYEEEEDEIAADYICSRCGGKKESAYDDYCYECQDNIRLREYINDDYKY